MVWGGVRGPGGVAKKGGWGGLFAVGIGVGDFGGAVGEGIVGGIGDGVVESDVHDVGGGDVGDRVGDVGDGDVGDGVDMFR